MLKIRLTNSFKKKFIPLWNSSASLKEFLERSGLPSAKASDIAYRLRKRGHKVKYMGCASQPNWPGETSPATGVVPFGTLITLKKSSYTPKVDIPVVSSVDFVRAWQQSYSVKEVSSKLGLPERNCSCRAMRFRKLGVQLKVYDKKKKEQVDVQSLNNLILELDKPISPRQAKIIEC